MEEQSLMDYIRCLGDFVSRVQCEDDEDCQERKRKAMECLDGLTKLMEQLGLSDLTASDGTGQRICLRENPQIPEG